MTAKTRNAKVFLPHPTSSDCTAEAVRICREAREAVENMVVDRILSYAPFVTLFGQLPEIGFKIVEKPTMEISNSVMAAEEIRAVLASGGPGAVQASYTSGKPAIGVGGGNAPVLVDELANLKVACRTHGIYTEDIGTTSPRAVEDMNRVPVERVIVVR